MPRYTLYRSLGLDRSRDPQQIAAQLDQWLKMPDVEPQRRDELRAARAILGDPAKRTEYDRRIDDPNAPEWTASEMRELAVRQGPASAAAAGGWGCTRPQGAPGSMVNGATAGSVTRNLSAVYRGQIAPAMSQLYGQTKEVFRTHPKPAIGVTAVAVIAVLSVGIVGVKVMGGDDGKDSTYTSSSLLGGSGSPSEGDTHAEAKDSFKNYEFLAAGEELTFTTGELYTYDDGSTKRSPDGGEYGVIVDNVRLIDHMSQADTSAPDDHPDATSHKDGTLVCYDRTDRIIKETADAMEARSSSRNYNPFSYYPDMYNIKVVPVINGEYLGNGLDNGGYSVPLGSTAPIIYNEDSGEWESEDGEGETQYSPDKMSATYSVCTPVAEAGSSDKRGVTADGSEPENYSGYVISVTTDESTATPSKDVRGWRFDH